MVSLLGLLLLLLLLLCSVGGVVMVILGVKRKRMGLWIGGVAMFLAPVMLVTALVFWWMQGLRH